MTNPQPEHDLPLVSIARRHGVSDERVLAAMRATPRSAFVPAESIEEADQDVPIPIGGRQTTSQPTLIAGMLAALELTGNEKVLEVGTGFGYQSALLAHLAAEVHSIDRSQRLVEAAGSNLDAAGIDNVHLHVGDGTLGCADAAPFDAIVVAAAAREVPGALAAQLADGGRMIIPVGAPDATRVVLYRAVGSEVLPVATVTAARFVPLVSGPPNEA